MQQCLGDVDDVKSLKKYMFSLLYITSMPACKNLVQEGHVLDAATKLKAPSDVYLVLIATSSERLASAFCL